MNGMRYVLVVLLWVSVLTGSTLATTPRVQVEIIQLTYTDHVPPEVPIGEQLTAWTERVENSPESLLSLLDDWLEGQDREKFEVDAVMVKAGLGQDVEVVAQEAALSNDQKQVERVPLQDLPQPLGMQAILRATLDEGTINLQMRVGKRTPIWLAEGEEVRQEDGRIVPGLQSKWFDTRLTLHPGVPQVLAGLIQEKKTATGNATSEWCVIVRVRPAAAWRED